MFRSRCLHEPVCISAVPVPCGHLDEFLDFARNSGSLIHVGQGTLMVQLGPFEIPPRNSWAQAAFGRCSRDSVGQRRFCRAFSRLRASNCACDYVLYCILHRAMEAALFDVASRILRECCTSCVNDLRGTENSSETLGAAARAPRCWCWRCAAGRYRGGMQGGSLREMGVKECRPGWLGDRWSLIVWAAGSSMECEY